MARRIVFESQILKSNFFRRNLSKPTCEVPNDDVKLALEKAKRRAELRCEFLKQKHDPFQHSLGDGGGVFDSALMRYNAMRDNQYDYFKTSPKQVLTGIFSLLLPIAAYTYFLYNDRNEKEVKYRRGEVAYKDRKNVFV